jgi:hypothetical protein
MSNPLEITFQDNFESGDDSGWSGGETDTGTYLDVVHYVTLAKIPGMPMPYSGAYCARWIVAGASSTADAIFTEGDIDIATSYTNWVKFNIWIDPDFKTTTTASDNIVLFEGNATANESFAFGIDYNSTTGALKWSVGTHATAATPDTDSTIEVKLGVWHTVELELLVVTGSAGGAISAYITEDGQEPSETATVTKTGVQNAAVTEGLLGVQDPAATTNCTILMDGFQFSGQNTDSGVRIYPTKNRFSATRYFLRSGNHKDTQGFHAFVGAGTVSNITLVTGADEEALLAVYDTDTAQAHMGNRKAILSQSGVGAGETLDLPTVPFDVIRGCYVDVNSANQNNEEIIVTIQRAPNWFSEGNMRRYAHRRHLGA